jgi:hypothetical protein
VFLKFGYAPEVTLYISISISIVTLFTRLIIISPLVDLSIIDFVRNVVFKIMFVTIIGAIIPLTIRYILPSSFYRLIIVGLLSMISVIFTVYFLGMDKREQNFVFTKINQIIRNLK